MGCCLLSGCPIATYGLVVGFSFFTVLLLLLFWGFPNPVPAFSVGTPSMVLGRLARGGSLLCLIN